jgi:hypothetical protein
MKKFIIVIFLSISLYSTYGQIDTIAENIYSYMGNFGIGIDSPKHHLTIVDNLSFEPERDFVFLHNKATDNYGEVRLKLLAGLDPQNAFYIGQTAEDYIVEGYKRLSHLTSTSQGGLLLRSRSVTGSIQFQTGFDGLVAFERMRITTDGNVGIGTNLPLYKLDVAGLINTSEGIRFPDGTIQNTAASSGSDWLKNGSGNLYNMGNIGIGNLDPEVKLRIEADIPGGNNQALIRLKNISTHPLAAVSMALESNDGQYGAAFSYTSNTFAGIPDLNNFNVISANGRGFAVYTTKPFSSIRFYTNMDDNGIIERMRITGDGNVGIGINSPSYKLDVAGLIKTSEGIKFADGSVQTSAASSSSSPDLYWQKNTSNIFRYDPVSIGRESMESYFKSKLWVHNGWLLVSDSGYNDAGMGVIHLSKTGYGFARSLHQVYDGVSGDPYTEFRIRNNDDTQTVRSWSVGIHHREDNKFKINTIGDVATGASPWYGENMLTILTSGFVGIGTSEPKAKVEVADGDIFISDINKGIIMKSPDGQCWKGTLDNSGYLSFAPVDCNDFTTIITANKLTKTPILTIFPNPAHNSVTIASIHNDLRDMEAVLFTIDGKIVKKVRLLSDYSEFKLNDIPEGTYILKVMNKKGKEIGSEKVIKTN